MQMCIRGLYPGPRGFLVADIFGYVTKGIPGVEVIGMEKYSRPLKEKLIYLTKMQGNKLSLKRYVICVDQIRGKFSNSAEAIRWLELPILILFWSLAEQIKFKGLETCIAMGMVNISGEVLVNPNLCSFVAEQSIPYKPFVFSNTDTGFLLIDLFSPFPQVKFATAEL